jgi:hypothetical protein
MTLVTCTRMVPSLDNAYTMTATHNTVELSQLHGSEIHADIRAHGCLRLQHVNWGKQTSGAGTGIHQPGG